MFALASAKYRWLFLALLTLSVVLGACGSGKPTSSPKRAHPTQLTVYASGRRIEILRRRQRRWRLPARIAIRLGPAHVDLAVPRHRALRTVKRAFATHASRVDLPVVPFRSTIAIRPVRQVLHNDCEVTALSMLLSAAGVQVGQLELQARLPRSGPRDPEPVPNNKLFRWGDPERGFVGRPGGGGTEGGFGVYEPPIRALAASFGVHLVDLHRRQVTAVRAAVLAGHPVLAWVGLAAGPYLSWLTPSGSEITVNLNEHAIILVGAGPGYVLVNNPLTGNRERWTDAVFSYRWKLLGERALELPRG